jgi:peptide alpha-N-acetyltransferase
MSLIDKELSEPYSIFTYRYFIYNWPNLCYIAISRSTGRAFGTVVCKLDDHRGMERGYLAMLTVEKEFRGRKIGTQMR